MTTRRRRRRKAKPWTKAEIRRLRKLYPVTGTADVARRMDRTPASIKSTAGRLGITKARGHKVWTKKDLRVLHERYPDAPTWKLAAELGRSTRALYARARIEGVRKSAAFLSSAASGRTSGGQGIGTRFKKGHEPWNKGMKGLQIGGRSRTTQFKKGNRPQTWRPIGSERITNDGYLQRKITDTGYTPRDWKGVHIIVWEEVHGPVPKGHAVCFINGDKSDIRPDNLELVSRQELMRRNSLHNYPPEITHAIQVRGALNRQINKRRREHEEQDRRSA